MVWGAIIGAAATIGSSLLATRANTQAASQASSAQNQAAQLNAEAQLEAARIQAEQQERAREEYREAAARGIEAIEGGTQRGIGAIRAGTQAGIGELYRAPAEYERTIAPMMRRPDMLTPTQQMAREDIQRSGRNLVAASGLRGAGRGAVQPILEADRRFMAESLEANQRRADQARGGLASIRAEAPARAGQALIQQGGAIGGMEHEAGTAIANTEIGAGSQVGQSLAAQGQFGAQAQQNIGAGAAQAAQNVGQIQAGATTANANIYGQALGSLGAIANEEWQRRRERARVI